MLRERHSQRWARTNLSPRSIAPGYPLLSSPTTPPAPPARTSNDSISEGESATLSAAPSAAGPDEPEYSHVEQARRIAGAEPENAVLLGDSVSATEVAHAAGVRALAMPRMRAVARNLKPPGRMLLPRLSPPSSHKYNALLAAVPPALSGRSVCSAVNAACLDRARLIPSGASVDRLGARSVAMVQGVAFLETVSSHGMAPPECRCCDRRRPCLRVDVSSPILSFSGLTTRPRSPRHWYHLALLKERARGSQLFTARPMLVGRHRFLLFAIPHFRPAGQVLLAPTVSDPGGLLDPVERRSAH